MCSHASQSIFDVSGCDAKSDRNDLADPLCLTRVSRNVCFTMQTHNFGLCMGAQAKSVCSHANLTLWAAYVCDAESERNDLAVLLCLTMVSRNVRFPNGNPSVLGCVCVRRKK